MLASILIIAVSLVLLVYWFRYTCILLLRNSEAVAPQADARFNFGAVREQLQVELQLDPLHAALERDYQLITYLLENASGLELDSIEERMLLWDYRIMRCWYRFARIVMPMQARSALAEMATVLSVLGGKLGERAGVQSEA
jgi:hypothetical protein